LEGKDWGGKPNAVIGQTMTEAELVNWKAMFKAVIRKPNAVIGQTMTEAELVNWKAMFGAVIGRQ